MSDTTPTPYSWLSRLLTSFVGLLLAPVVGGTTVLMTMAWPSGNFVNALAQSVWITGLFGIPAAILVGWPIHLLLIRLRKVGVWLYIGLGGAIGVSVILFYIGKWAPLQFYATAFFGGAIGGGVFWLVRRPDKDLKEKRLVA